MAETILTDKTRVAFNKGDRVRAQWYQAQTSGFSLAGMQLKFLASARVLVGRVAHVRGNHPTQPTEIRVYLDPEEPYDGPMVTLEGCTCGRQHVELQPAWIQEVL